MFLKDLREFNLPKLEEKVLDYWKKNRIFEKSLEKRKTLDARRRKFTFYEGPPTANGRPGLHHVLARVFKDVILRYKTMRGFYVPRKAGWDTHGLPVEIQVEKELGLKSKKDIEKFGIAEFNKKCRESVWKYKDEFERLTERMGFWLDMKNPYVTYEKDYIETLWWIIAQFWKKKLLYKGNRIVNWCPRCGTGLSSHEMSLGYKEVVDNSVYVKFKVRLPVNSKWQSVKNKEIYILSWTTTPWTLPGNVALAVGEKIDYVIFESEMLDVGSKTKEIFILAKDLVKKAGVEGKVIREVKGKDLVGLSYEPLFEVEPLQGNPPAGSGPYRVYAADFVTTTDGTGVVHTAVMYGEDDYKLGVKLGLPQHHTVDEAGKFTKDVKGFAGLFVKGKETEKKIFDYLEKNNTLLKKEPYKHEYPHCWRCGTPLLYYARSSWFVAMAKLKRQLITNNENINWIPEHIKEGRFGEWLREVKDWNFSRERYWGTPLPIWECKKCGHTEAVESLDDLNKKAGGARNEYFLMRHGQSEAMILGVIDSGGGKYKLTDFGRQQAEKAAKLLAKEKIGMIFASDVLRAKETAQIVSNILGLKKIFFDKRIREINLGGIDGKPAGEYAKVFPTLESRFEGGPERGESLRMLRARVWDFISETEKKFKGKKILIVSHEYPIWMLTQVMEGWTERQAISEMGSRKKFFINPSEIQRADFKYIPRDETGEVDLHRPYADEILLKCPKCKGETKRVKELCDVWFDSGAMPFAQGHWPFAQNQKSKIKNQNLRIDFPADYICEAVDQTRGWFYTLLAVATALGKGEPYKNVICLGHINDKYGQKMSKSKGNVVDPWLVAEKYGMDAVRWYFYTATPPGEPKNFDEQEILKTYRRFHLILWNSVVFYLTYAGKKLDVRGKMLDGEDVSNFRHSTSNVLDEWILARLDETEASVTKNFDKYQVREAALAIESLTDDLSRWYIRRSRRRLQKSDSKADFEACSATLRHVIVSILKMAAPFNPFFTELLWSTLDVRGKKLDGKENSSSNIQHPTSNTSIHLQEWATKNLKIKNKNEKLLKQMEEIRRLAAIGLAKRAEAGVKVRQPLATLKIKNKKSKIKISEELLEILAEEVNVKKVVFNPKIVGEVELDIKITAELKEEGVIRELARMVQDLRQKGDLHSNDAIVLMMELPEEIRRIVAKNEALLKKEVGAKIVEYKKSEKFGAEIATKLENQEVWVGVRKL